MQQFIQRQYLIPYSFHFLFDVICLEWECPIFGGICEIYGEISEFKLLFIHFIGLQNQQILSIVMEWITVVTSRFICKIHQLFIHFLHIFTGLATPFTHTYSNSSQSRLLAIISFKSGYSFKPQSNSLSKPHIWALLYMANMSLMSRLY